MLGIIRTLQTAGAGTVLFTATYMTDRDISDPVDKWLHRHTEFVDPLFQKITNVIELFRKREDISALDDMSLGSSFVFRANREETFRLDQMAEVYFQFPWLNQELHGA